MTCGGDESLLVVRGDFEELKTIGADLSERFGDVLECCSSGRTVLDIQKSGRNKGVMLAELARRIGGNRRVYAVGDCYNDLEMLRSVDVPCCPSSAVPEVKNICSNILCSNNEGVLADLVGYIKRKKQQLSH